MSITRAVALRRSISAGVVPTMFCFLTGSVPVAAESPERVSLPCIVRDFKPSPDAHPDFDGPHLNGPYAQYVQLGLDESHKPVYSLNTGHRVHQEWRDADNNKISWCLPPAPGDNPGTFGGGTNGAVTSSDTFAQWFRDELGVNVPSLWWMTLTLETHGPDAGSYSFETNDLNPLDRHGPDENDDYFTLEMVCTFTYDEAAEQFVRFKGDDDTWIFINDRLVMDHGGIAGSREYYVEVDRLGLSHGERYDIRLFHAERKQPQSQFHLWTNIDLRPKGVTTLSAVFD